MYFEHEHLDAGSLAHVQHLDSPCLSLRLSAQNALRIRACSEYSRACLACCHCIDGNCAYIRAGSSETQLACVLFKR